MIYEQKDFSRLIGLPGMSDALLNNHFALYGGYVKNVNALAEKIDALRAAGNAATPEYAELKRRFGWEWNGMRLHELYFGNLTKETALQKLDSPLAQAIAARWGNADAWMADFKAVGAMRGIGWAMLVKTEDGLENIWVNEHDGGHLAGAKPVVVMDVFEHAFMLDYGVKRADYLAAFAAAIDWAEAERRFAA